MKAFPDTVSTAALGSSRVKNRSFLDSCFWNIRADSVAQVNRDLIIPRNTKKESQQLTLNVVLTKSNLYLQYIQIVFVP